MNKRLTQKSFSGCSFFQDDICKEISYPNKINRFKNLRKKKSFPNNGNSRYAFYTNLCRYPVKTTYRISIAHIEESFTIDKRNFSGEVL